MFVSGLSGFGCIAAMSILLVFCGCSGCGVVNFVVVIAVVVVVVGIVVVVKVVVDVVVTVVSVVEGVVEVVVVVLLGCCATSAITSGLSVLKKAAPFSASCSD